MLRKIISSGQSGVERAALDSALQMTALSFGGWCPRGKAADDGQLGQQYFGGTRGGGLTETNSSRPASSIRLNIQDADATLILRSSRILPDKAKLCIKMLRDSEKSYQICDPSKVHIIPRVVRWICEPLPDGKMIETLNITGPKESEVSGIYSQSFQYITDILHLVAIFKLHGIKIWSPKRNKET